MRKGFSVAEVLVALGLFGALIASATWLFSYGGRATARLQPKLAAQAQARKAFVRMLRELQEGMKVLTPAPGMTLPYAVIVDKEGAVAWFYQTAEGRVYRQGELLLSGVRRLTFTSQSEGALTINALLADEEQESAILTTVRLRNIAAAEELW